MIRYTVVVFIFIFLSLEVSAQSTTESGRKDSCMTKDMTDWFRQWFKIKKPTKEKTSAIFFAPIIGSTPSTGFLIGATLQTAFRMPGSKLSAFQANIQYTFKNQFLVFLRNAIYAKDNRILLTGDWRFFIYAEPTYGLGTNAPKGTLPYYFHFMGEGEATDSLSQPMDYKYFKVHQIASFRVADGWFVGAGVHLDIFDDIEDHKLDTPFRNITSHYAYSRKYGFNPESYKQIGVSLNIVYDTRDNMVNAYKGIFANVNYRFNPSWLGSDKSSSAIWSEFRYFKGVSRKYESMVLAFWLIGNFSVGGDQPYLGLPALGYDQRSKTGRGYTIGRFRGENMVYGETEFRFPISKCTGTLGGVVFVNAVTTDNKDASVGLLDYVQPGFGVGIRLLFNKQTRMNIQVDYGRGKRSSGIYFGASEVF